MRLIQTVMLRDEVDVIDAQISYHLSSGVDFVVAIDHDSRDGTSDILESYARDGHLVRIPKTGKMQESAWRTRDGPSRGHGIRRRLDPQHRRRRVLDDPGRRAAQGRVRRDPGALRRRVGAHAALRAASGERAALRRPHDRARLDDGSRQRPDEPVPTAREGRASGRPEHRRPLRRSSREQPAETPERLVPRGRAPLSLPLARAVPAQEPAESARRPAARPVREGGRGERARASRSLLPARSSSTTRPWSEDVPTGRSSSTRGCGTGCAASGNRPATKAERDESSTTSSRPRRCARPTS